MRRSTALTRPDALVLPALRARSTASFTAADAGMRSRWSSWNAVSRRMSRTSGSSLCGRPRGKRRDDDVEGSLPPHGAGRDFSRQRAIALVVQPRADAGERRREIGAAGAHRAEHVVRGLTRRRNHGEASRTPGVNRCPLRNSRALITRRPSGWICRRSSSTPSPAATVSVSPPAWTTVPGSGGAFPFVVSGFAGPSGGVRLQPDHPVASALAGPFRGRT